MERKWGYNCGAFSWKSFHPKTNGRRGQSGEGRGADVHRGLPHPDWDDFRTHQFANMAPYADKLIYLIRRKT